MSQKGMEWPGLSAALAGFLPLRPDMRHLVPGAEGLIYTPTPYKYSYINQKSFALALVFAISAGLSALMWLTSAYDNAILKLVSIRDDIDTVFENWRYPPTKPRLFVYIFNYTNSEKFLEGKEMPKVQEMGPYVFSEEMERINVVFNPNSTVTFQEVKRIEPLPNESNGTFNDMVWVPNIPYLTIVNVASSADYAVQTVFSVFGSSSKVTPFLNVSVNDFIWGIRDNFFESLRKMKQFFGDESLKPFGFLAKRKGFHPDIITMNTGNRDLDTVGIITRWNGASKIGKWGNTTCDSMESTDGSMFPGRLVMRGEPLYVYAHSMCRRIPLRFNRTTLSKDGFPVQQYNVAEDMFDYSIPENSCFDYNGKYPMKGVFSNAPCQNGAPIYTSFPHFWQGDATLRQDVEGLNPDPKKHYSYFQIHEKLGICLRVRTRFQLNIVLKKPIHVNELSKLPKEVILPVGWLDYDSGDLSEPFINTLYHLTYTVRIVEEVLKWLLLSITIGSLTFLLLEVKKCIKK
ncbi:unnamed protein product [Nezara viridula]|uniref:Scavenger receptor class B member 1 n=1 Tax=Nezara viridula TaxID=85310 RepID=A0A9P0ECF6_NEZVI|nr:unnamed protein product [Nezara viridula]